MNPVIFPKIIKRRMWFIALCECGHTHGPYATVGDIPECCPDCEARLRQKGA